MTDAGCLWVVATPIGNLDDLSLRAAQVLRDVALIAAEDTRHSAALLARAGSHVQTMALHEHNEQARTEAILARLAGGDDVALISDAGTPLISDPGFRLVRAARQAGYRVSPIPGPCAAIAALSVAGLPSDRFVFEGFLSARSALRRTRMTELASESRTLIFYEASHRIAAMLDDAVGIFGARRESVLAREMTKRFETVLSGSLAELAGRVAQDADQRRGEFVVIIAGATDEDADAKMAEGRRVFTLLREELPPARAAKLAAAITGAARKALYKPEDR